MIGVIPAGGQAQRFMGIHKEMLPIGEGQFLLTEAMLRAKRLGAERCIVVSSAEKAALHERLLTSKDSLLVSTGWGLWTAIRATFPFRESSILVLPDTIFTIKDPVPSAPLAFGVFKTTTPQRYSIFSDGVIVTKPKGIETEQLAWGCVSWTPEVITFWKNNAYAHYDDAFNAAIVAFGYKTFSIGDYQDLGDWESYRRFIIARESS